MALIICSECGKEFSDKATACPNCACPVEKEEEIEVKELKCEDCGTVLEEGAVFCSNCGCPVEEKTEEVVDQTVYTQQPVQTLPKKSNKTLWIALGVGGGLLLFIIVIVVVLLLVINPFGPNYLGTYEQSGGASTTLILKKDGSCSMVMKNTDSTYVPTVSQCNYSVDSKREITINFTMTVSNGYYNYTKDGSLTGTVDGKKITMSGGAIYYKK